jgi:hypothetical protein
VEKCKIPKIAYFKDMKGRTSLQLTFDMNLLHMNLFPMPAFDNLLNFWDVI